MSSAFIITIKFNILLKVRKKLQEFERKKTSLFIEDLMSYIKINNLKYKLKGLK